MAEGLFGRNNAPGYVMRPGFEQTTPMVNNVVPRTTANGVLTDEQRVEAAKLLLKGTPASEGSLDLGGWGAFVSSLMPKVAKHAPEQKEKEQGPPPDAEEARLRAAFNALTGQPQVTVPTRSAGGPAAAGNLFGSEIKELKNASDALARYYQEQAGEFGPPRNAREVYQAEQRLKDLYAEADAMPKKGKLTDTDIGEAALKLGLGLMSTRGGFGQALGTAGQAALGQLMAARKERDAEAKEARAEALTRGFQLSNAAKADVDARNAGRDLLDKARLAALGIPLDQLRTAADLKYKDAAAQADQTKAGAAMVQAKAAEALKDAQLQQMRDPYGTALKQLRPLVETGMVTAEQARDMLLGKQQAKSTDMKKAEEQYDAVGSLLAKVGKTGLRDTPETRDIVSELASRGQLQLLTSPEFQQKMKAKGLLNP